MDEERLSPGAPAPNAPLFSLAGETTTLPQPEWAADVTPPLEVETVSIE